jgi:hypothetical protein
VKDFVSVPVELCKYALTHQLDREVRLYIYLKANTSGYYNYTKENKLKLCEALGYKSSKTFDVHVQWLIKNKWVTVNSKTNCYRIIGFGQLAKKLHFKSSTGALFDPPEYDKFKEFCFAAYIKYLFRWKGRKRQSVLRYGNTSTNCTTPPKMGQVEFSESYLAQALGLAKSTISKYKMLTEKAGYLSVQKRYAPLKELTIGELPVFKQWAVKIAHKLVIHNGKPCEQLTDKLEATIVLRTKRPLKRHIRS